MRLETPERAGCSHQRLSWVRSLPETDAALLEGERQGGVSCHRSGSDLGYSSGALRSAAVAH